MALEHILDHAARSVGRLLSQYRGLPTVEAFATQLGLRVQELEDTLWDIIAQTAIPTATGVWLDGLGRVVGETRQGSSDADYRLWILARIRANQSDGTLEDLLAVLSLGGFPTATVRDYGTASFETQLGFTSPVSAERLSRILATARSAAIGGMLLYQAQADASSFTWADADVLQADAARGWADDSPITSGGRWADAFRT